MFLISRSLEKLCLALFYLTHFRSFTNSIHRQKSKNNLFKMRARKFTIETTDLQKLRQKSFKNLDCFLGIGVSRKFAFEISRPLVHSTNVEDGHHKLRCISAAQTFRIVCYRLIISRKLLLFTYLLRNWTDFFIQQYCHVVILFKFFDKSVKKRGVLKFFNLYMTFKI